MITIWIILILLAVVGWLIYLFNTLVGLSNHADAAWAEIDAQLKRRYDLVDQLIALAKAQGVTGTEPLAAARSAAADSYTPTEKGRCEPALAEATQSLLVAAAANSALAGNEEFAQLRRTLEDIENYLHEAGRRYNLVAQELNDQTGAFPNNLAASLFGLESRELFRADGEKPQAA
jgi:LemA protein